MFTFFSKLKDILKKIDFIIDLLIKILENTDPELAINKKAEYEKLMSKG